MGKKARRYQVRWVTESEVWDLFTKRWILPTSMRLHLNFLEGVPQSADVVQVFYDPMRKCFGFILEDESFEVVADGAEIPDGCRLSWESVVVVVDKEQNRELAIPGYNLLLEENKRLRAILSDYLEDNESHRLVWEQAVEETRRSMSEADQQGELDGNGQIEEDIDE